MKNSFLTKIEQHLRPFGTFAELGGANAAEALGQTGLDYIIIDNEHGHFDVESSEECIRACELTGLTPLCRIREVSRPAVMKLLDVGAQGLIVPYIESMDEIRRLVDYGKYPPLGKRGYCPSKKDGWGYAAPGTLPMQAQFTYWNRETLLIPQCETAAALEKIEEITKVDGVDGIFIGPYDLSISMGIPGQFDDPVFTAALERILAACKAAGKFTMVYTGNLSAINGYYEQGFDVVTYGMDAAVLIEGFRSIVSGLER